MSVVNGTGRGVAKALQARREINDEGGKNRRKSRIVVDSRKRLNKSSTRAEVSKEETREKPEGAT